MAVFMLNVCKFNGCGLTFKSLGHLIQHIEETHIDYDPHVVEQTELQQPTCIPLSYALRFLTDAARKECSKTANQGRLNQANALVVAASTRNRNSAATPTGSEAEEGDEFASEPDDSNDSWTTSEEFSADFILRYGSRVINQSVPNPPSNNNVVNNSGSGSNSNSIDKPFACPVPGCKKRYKNVNGIKYHSKNGHKKDGKVRKAFRCPCGKSYKTPSGLKNHAVVQHAGSVLQNGKVPSSLKFDNQTSQHHRDHITKSIVNTGNSMRVGKQPLAKIKVAAIEDHGYIKSEKPIFTDSTSAIRECGGGDDEELGILTPASTPPLPSPAKNDINLSPTQQQQQQQQDKSLQKYLGNVVASCNNNQQRRSVVDN